MLGKTVLALSVLLLLPASQDRQREATLRLIARDYKAAIDLLARELADREADPEQAKKKGADRVLFLLGSAKLESGDAAGAQKDFRRLGETYPRSQYAFLTRFRLADALARSRRFQEAAGVYQTEVARVLSAERRVRLAETYLELVEKRLRQDPPDHKGAISFLDLAVALELPRDKSHELRLRAAQIAFDAKDYGQAATRFEQLAVGVRGTVFGGGGRASREPAWQERLWLAKAWRWTGNVQNARRLLEDLLREGIPGPQGPEALLELAHCFGVPKSGAQSARGIDVLQRFLSRYPRHEEAPGAAYLLAQTQAANHRLEEALATLDLLLERYSDTDTDRRAHAAADRGTYLARLRRHDDAIAAWKDYLAKFPAHSRWMDAQRAVVDLELQRAEAEREKGKASYDRAAELYRAFLNEHPLDGRSRAIYLTLGGMEEERERFEEARRIYERTASKYPGSVEASDAAFRVGRLLETKLFNYAAALEAYRKVKGPFGARAAQRIRVLEEKSLTLRTERTYRTNEKPRVELVSRNVPELRVRVYKLDLETFFRGTLGQGSVEALAVEVISPDRSFTSKVEEYVPHKETERSIEVPFAGAGAYVVKVDDSELEATTLVLVSDLALVTKSSRKELFVFAQNTRQARAESGARVFVTDGGKIVAEGVTDGAGSYRFAGKALENAGRLHVFARTDDGSAATTLELGGLRIAQGLVPKAFLYSDRSVYRPGESCGVRAILRDVEQGVYVVPKGDRYELDWIDAQGRTLASRSLEPSTFGTLAARFEVPAQAIPGSFALRLRRKSDGRVMATQGVQVARFEAPRVALEVQSERKVLVRGERIEGKVAARYFFGGPVAGKKIEVATDIGGKRVLRGTTDEAGEFPFSFETSTLQASTAVSVHATVPEEQAVAGAHFLIRETEFSVALETPSSVYLAGDDLEAKVTCKAHDGKPLARGFTVELLRLESGQQGVTEIPVARESVTTDTKAGAAFARFRPAKGGSHRLRVWGEDRLGNRIDARRDLFVSGKDDEVKLRVLSSKQHGKVGDVVTLRVMNRVGPKLCLVTIEGDGVLESETKLLAEGETRIELPLRELHAPNFAWAVAIVADKDLHQARKDFVVSRLLAVEVVPGPERLVPGGKLSLEIAATNSRGRPVQAEFSVAVVDQAILDLYPDRSPDLYEVFYGPGIRRVTELRTASSATFRYRGRTRRVNQELKAEERRRDREAEDEKARRAWASDDFRFGRGVQPESGRRAGDRPGLATGPTGGARDRMGPDRARLQRDGARGQVQGGFAGNQAYFTRLDQQHQQVMLQKQLESISMFAGVRAVMENDALGLSNENAAGEANAGEPGIALASDPSVWRAAVRTGEDGRGRVELDMPERDGSWRIRVRGVTEDSLVGEGTASVVTAKELIVNPRIPPVLTENDEARVEIGLHNLAEGEADVRWTVTHEDGKQEGRARVPGRGNASRSFTYTARAGGEKRFDFAAESGASKDAHRVDVDVRPWAIEERAARSGLLSGSVTVRLQLPAGDYRGRGLVIDLGPDVAGELLPKGPVLRRSRLSCYFPDWVPPTHANRAGAGLAALALYRHWSAGSPRDAGALAGLRGRIEGTIASLQSLESGGEVRWIGQGGSSKDPRATLLAGRFLVQARAAGFVVDDGVLARFRSKLAEYLRARDHDVATLAFLVSAEDTRADFTRFNTLYRARQNLSLRAKGKLALAALAMGRPGLAQPLLADLAHELGAMLANDGARRSRRPAPGIDERRVEAVLWALNALQNAKGHGELLDRGERWVHAHRRPWGWSSSIVTALAVEFLTGRKTAAEAVASTVEVDVNGKFSKTVDFRTDSSHRQLVVPGEAVESGENRITLRTSGKGRIVWSALLTGTTRGLPEKRIGSDRLERTYLQAPPVLDGAVLPEGFTSVDSRLKRWKNLATEVAVGGSVRATLRYAPASELRARVGSFVIEEPLPAGTLVLPSEISGNHDHVEIGRGFLRFYVHETRGRLQVSYTLRGVVPGRYRVLPARLFSLDDPSISLYGGAGELTVRGPGEEVTDARRPTPDELFARGTRLFDRLSHAQLESDAAARGAAERHLQKLYEDLGEHLRDKQFREVARRLLRISLAENDHGRTVRVFEALKDRDEDYVLGFDDMSRVGQSYYSTGEFERALVVYQAIVETSFLKEVQVAGTLDSIGELRASIEFMRTLFVSFPGVPTVRSAMYSLAQSLNRKAREVEAAGKVDPKVGTSLELKRTARDLCYEFLLRHPSDADADEVVFTLASVALEAEQLDEGLELLSRARGAFADSAWLDDFTYLAGYAHFLKGERDEALALLQKVAEEDFPLGGGRRGKSDSRWLATFLRGQIHHAAGRPGAALAEYAKVEQRFPDAREAADYFRRKRLGLPEVTLLEPGDKTRVKLSYRNLAHVDLTVFKVDLMRLYLLRKSLNDMGDVQLFGIAPVHERRIELTGGEDWRDHDREIEFPADAAGAYLVLARSGELKSSGLVLRTALEIEVQELADQGRLRVNVKRDGVFLPKATVKVVGDRDGNIRTGKTDLRGIYVADDVQGRATVLAQAGDSYAFYRGKVSFGGPAPKPQRAGQPSKDTKLRTKFDALLDNSRRNVELQDERRKQLEDLYRNKQQGVEIKRAK